ncbi:MAG: glycosyltransferase family 9 protein [Myxococcota bacterium]
MAAQQQAERIGVRKRFELWGRRILMRVLGALLGRRREAIAALDAPKVLVIRLDERVGNVVMLTPVLRTLRARFPDGHIHVLGNVRGEALLGGHPDVDRFIGFRKRAIFAADGPLRIISRLRREKYSVAIDASNPTDPSLTQAILASLSGARFTVGSDARGFGHFFSQSVAVSPAHEIDLRLQLLDALPGDTKIRAPFLPALPEPKERPADDYLVLNLGARLPEKRLSADEYAQLADGLLPYGALLLTWGPAERSLSHEVALLVPSAKLAPPTNLRELAAIMAHARAVVTCDTGPMHLSVALGTPTLSIFLTTDPERFGYCGAPNALLDARTERSTLKVGVERWLSTLSESGGLDR